MQGMLRHPRARQAVFLASALVAGLGMLAWLSDPSHDVRGMPVHESDWSAASPAESAAPSALLAGTSADPLRFEEGGRVAQAEEIVEAVVASTYFAGQVVRADGGEPIAGAHIAFAQGESRVEGESDAKGEFRLGLYATAAGDLEVHSGQFRDVRAPRVDPSEYLRIALEPSAALIGRVQDARGGPASGVELGLWRYSGSGYRDEPVARVTSVVDGSFAFLDIDPGEYGLGVLPGPHPFVFVPGLVLATGERVERVLTLPPVRSLRGRVLTAGSRAPIQGARLRMRPVGGVEDDLAEQVERLAESDAAGEFVFTGLCQGAWNLVTRTTWGATHERRLWMDAAGELAMDVEIVFPAPASLAGSVRWSDGAPAAGAIVHVMRADEADDFELLEASADGEAIDAVAPCDADGRYRIEAVAAEVPLLVLAVLEREDIGMVVSPARSVILAPAEARGDLELQLEQGERIDGQVVDQSGGPVADAEVVLDVILESSWCSVARTRTDAEGRFGLSRKHGMRSRLLVECEGFRTRRVGLDDVASATVPLLIVLESACLLDGCVLDPDGWAVPGAGIRASLLNGGQRPPNESETADDFGRFRFDSLVPGSWQLEASSAGVRDPERRIVAVPDQTYVQLLFHPRPRPARATVVAEIVDAATGGAVAGLSVNGSRGAFLGIEGTRVTVQGLDAQDLSLTFQAESMEPLFARPKGIQPGERVDLGRLEMRHASVLRVRIEDPSGESVRGLRVELRAVSPEHGGWPGGWSRMRLEPTGDGTWEARTVPRYAWTLDVSRGSRSIHRELVRIDDPVVNLAVELPVTAR